MGYMKAEATFCKWFSKYRTGNMSIEDDEPPGCTKGAISEKNFKYPQNESG